MGYPPTAGIFKVKETPSKGWPWSGSRLLQELSMRQHVLVFEKTTLNIITSFKISNY